jgi:hypothetical protein
MRYGRWFWSVDETWSFNGKLLPAAFSEKIIDQSEVKVSGNISQRKQVKT